MRRKKMILALCAVFLVNVLLILLFQSLPDARAAVYRRGSAGSGVTELQEKLLSWGYYSGEVDGIYGSRTEAAVKSFQRKNGLSADGVAGPATLAAMGISGLFSPWTGEVILDPRGADGLMYFTAVHEQTHLAGIADEGEANIAAWEVCMARGGAWADSARLWALRYALAMLGRTDEPAAHRVTGRMSPALAARFAELSSADTSPNPVARLLGIVRQTTDYDDLARWVISAESGKVKKGC